MKASRAHSILIFDPDAASESRIAGLLKEAGYHAVPATAVDLAEHATSARRPQLVLSSFPPSEFNGLRLALHCLALAPATPLLVIGPAEDLTLAREAARLGLEWTPTSTGALELVALITHLVGPAQDGRH